MSATRPPPFCQFYRGQAGPVVLPRNRSIQPAPLLFPSPPPPSLLLVLRGCARRIRKHYGTPGSWRRTQSRTRKIFTPKSAKRQSASCHLPPPPLTCAPSREGHPPAHADSPAPRQLSTLPRPVRRSPCPPHFQTLIRRPCPRRPSSRPCRRSPPSPCCNAVAVNELSSRD